MWIPQSDGTRLCATHPDEPPFDGLNSCRQCLADPPDDIDNADDEHAFDLPPPPLGCSTMTQMEAAFNVQARYADSLAKRFAAMTPCNGGIVAKLIAESTKARRAAAMLAKEREDREFVKLLERRRKEIARGGNH